MSFESNLRYFYDTSPNELQKNFNLEATQNTTDEKVIQIIGTLMANYVELNHSKIDQELKRELENHAWIILSTTQAQNPAVYVFYAQILANILFNFYEQSWSDEFIEKVQQLIQIKPESGFVVLEEIIRRLKPSDDSHKESMISFDSRYRTIKNLFYKQHLNKLIDMILYCLKYPEHINQSLNIFLLILETEFVTDTRTKDWHILKSAEIKNILSLEFQLKECKLQLLENNILERILQQNSNNPFSNQLGCLWVKVRDMNFIQFIVDLVPHYPQAHKVLKKICKIFKKHFRGETTQINHMTLRLQQITGYHKGQFLSLAGKTLFASCDINWVHYNLQLMDATCIIEAFKFMRDLCRIARSQDYTSLAYLLMPKIINLYETAIKTGIVDRKPIKYCVKVISTLMIQQYLEYFYEQIALAQNLFEGELAFEFLYIGLLASMSATSYQLDYVNKIRFIQEDRILYPVNVQLFRSFDYVSFYRQWLANSYNVSIVLSQQSGKPSIFIYKLWKKLLNPFTNIKYQDLIGDNSISFLNLSQVVTFDLKYIIKGLILILNSTVRWKSEASYEINRIEVPVQSIEKFYQLDIVINPKVAQYYYTIQSKFVNAQCDWLQDVDSMLLLKQHFSNQVFDLAQKMTQDHQILFFTSLLKEQGSSSYVEIMKTFQSQNLFDTFLNYRVSYSSLLKLSISMINEQQVNKLNSQIVNNIYLIILNLSEKLLWFLQSKYAEQQKERQVKRQQKENYKEYYKPLIIALRLYEKTRALNKAQCTHTEYKERIPIFIFRILDLIIIDDLVAYIHKLGPLFELIKQIMISKSWIKVMDTSNLITIVKFIDQAIQIQERKTLSLALEILNDIMSEKDLIMKNEVTSKNLIQEFIPSYNHIVFKFEFHLQLICETGLIDCIEVYDNHNTRYVIQFPQNYDALFLKELPKQINIQEEIVNIYISKVNLIKEFIPMQISKQAERDFQDYFVQLQILCCYYI